MNHTGWHAADDLGGLHDREHPVLFRVQCAGRGLWFESLRQPAKSRPTAVRLVKRASRSTRLDGDNGSTTTTTAGANPVYPMNRVYSPDNALLNTGCTTTSNKVTKLSTKCSNIVPSTCGYLYCV